MSSQDNHCPFCKKPIHQEARKCAECDEYIDGGLRNRKRVWEILRVLGIPAAIVILGWWLGNQQAIQQREIEAQRARSNLVQSYLDAMSAAVRQSDQEDPIQLLKTDPTIKARTIATMQELDGPGNDIILSFLKELGWLVTEGGAILSGASLSGVDLRGCQLYGADLAGTDLTRADLRGTILLFADLSNADMEGANVEWAYYNRYTFWPDDFTPERAFGPFADLRGLDLRDSGLYHADLHGVKLHGADLRRLDLSNTNMTSVSYDDETKWPRGFDPSTQGAVQD